MAKATLLPREIIVYVADILEDHTPVFGVARNIEEMPEEIDGDKVGVYRVNRTNIFHVRRELI